jgi:hypothetical protein
MRFKVVSVKSNICMGCNKITSDPKLVFYIRRLLIYVLYILHSEMQMNLLVSFVLSITSCTLVADKWQN